MHKAAVQFSHDTLDSERRESMVAAARALLMAVTRLMVVVDAVDVQRMFRTSNRVQPIHVWPNKCNFGLILQMEVKLQALYSVSSEAQLMRAIRSCTPDITRLTQLAEQRVKVSHMSPMYSYGVCVCVCLCPGSKK